MKAVDLMIFDFDGTLVNTGKDLVSSVNYTLTSLSLPNLTEDKIISFIGDGVRKLIERSLGSAFPEYFERAMILFNDYYEKHLLDKTRIYPGVRDMLEHFHDKKKVVMTNKRHGFTVQIMDALHLTPHFDEIIGEDSRPYRKPDPRLVQPLLKQFGTSPERTVVIGDGLNDILLAKNSGALSCAFLGGLGANKMLISLRPDFTFNETSELKGLFY